ncbi:MAG: type II toxin-antitoxin system VapC family toxin [Alphaproteobacteria bacterium]|nr:type II toxin-antitoxin system VapC family toxin [Alphaproteobacteria bacterium]
MYLIDTVVLSELRKRERHAGIVRWLRDKTVDALFLSAITIGEIERGMLRQRVRNPVFAEALGAWLDRTVETFGERILAVDTRVARRWGRLSARLGHSSADLLIAATALENGLTVVTRNVRHFLPTGVLVEDPFQDPV